MRLLLDCETNGLDFSDGAWLPRVQTVFCLVIKNLDTGNISKYYDTDGLRELGTGTVLQGIQELKQATELSGHNIIQFDLPVLRKLYGFIPKCRTFDTLVASRTLYPDRIGGHSLGAWGDKLRFPKGDHNDFDGFSPEMLEYCVRDVELNSRVYEALRQEAKQGQWDKALDLEHKIAEIIARQEEKGFYFNGEQAKEYLAEWEKEIDNIDNTVIGRTRKRVLRKHSVAQPFKINGALAKRTLTVADQYGINSADICGPFDTFEYKPHSIASKTQQKEVLLELGWEPEQYTKTGTPKIDDSILGIGIIGEKLHRRNVLGHRRSQVAGLLALQDEHGRVHGGANPCGTNTSRMKHQRIVNIPRASSPLGREIRSLFTVPSGKVLLGYDAASLELRVLAHYIGSQEYNERICSTNKLDDAHTLAATAAGSDDRDIGKTINYALIYGAGDGKLGSIVGGTAAEGERIRSRLYDRIPGMARLVSQAKSAAKRGFIISLDGRKLYTRPRVSPLNTLIQGGGSIFMKTVAALLDQYVKQDNLTAFKVVDMHDEAQWEVDPEEVPALSSLIEDSFIEACSLLELRCPQEPEIKTGTNWSQTH